MNIKAVAPGTFMFVPRLKGLSVAFIGSFTLFKLTYLEDVSIIKEGKCFKRNFRLQFANDIIGYKIMKIYQYERQSNVKNRLSNSSGERFLQLT